MSGTLTISKTVCLICVLVFEFILTVSSQCPSLTLTATDDLSTFTSPGYSSGSYANDLSCSWTINSGSASATVVIFITNYNVTSPDQIDIYDGFSTSNSTLASGLTGTGTNRDYKTTGQYALVVLTTDSSVQAEGFTAQYIKAADLSGTGCTAEQTIAATTTAQYLTSPAFPNEYTGNSNCRWIITATDGTVEFELLLSDIETSPNCGFDYLKIYDSSYLCEHTLTVDACTRYPGTTATYSSNGTSILVKFVSDASVGYTGFKLKFTSVSVLTTTTTTSATTSVEEKSSGFGLGIGVGFASGFITALITVGLIFVIKSRVQATQFGSPRVRNVLPMQTPTSINENISRMNGHVPNGEIINGHLPRNQRLSVTSSHSPSGNSSRNGRTPSTGPNSPIYSDTQNTTFTNNNNHTRNGVLPTTVDQ